MRQTAKDTAGAPGELICSRAEYDANDNVSAQEAPIYLPYTPTSDCLTGARTTFTYDAMDRPTGATEPAHDPAAPQDPNSSQDEWQRAPRTTELSYDAAGRLQSSTLPQGVYTTGVGSDHKTSYSYDKLDRVITELVHFEGGIGGRRTHLCYDLAGDLRNVIAPKANRELAPQSCSAPVSDRFITYLEYDQAHRLIARTGWADRAVAEPVPLTQRYSYDANGNVVGQTDEDGVTQVSTYNQRGELVLVEQPFEQEANGKVTRSLTTKLEYDPVGRLVREISPRAWDAAGDRSEGFPDYVTSYHYDDAGRLTRVGLPADGVTRQAYIHRSYDPNGNLLSSSAPVDTADPSALGSELKTQLSYFDPGWIRSTDDPGKGKVVFDYTAHGWQSSRDAPHTVPETWAYYPDGLLQQSVEPTEDPTIHKYDLNGNATYVSDASGPEDASEGALEVELSYDGFGEPVSVRQRKVLAGGPQPWRITSYTHDSHGNLATRIDEGRGNSFVYDELDRLLTHRDEAAAGCADDQELGYAYRPTSLLQRETIKKSDSGCDPAAWPVRQKTEYSYFANGDLKTQETTGLNGALLESHTLAYISNGRYLNGHRVSDTFRLKGPETGAPCVNADCVAEYRYDARERLEWWRSGPVATAAEQRHTIDYTFDLDTGPVDRLAGDVMREEVTNPPSGSAQRRSYTYKSSGQLDELREGSLTTDWGQLPVKARYFYGPQSGNLTCIAKRSYTGETCPEAVPDRVATYRYDVLDRLAGATSYTDSGADKTVGDYFYDAFDRVSWQKEKHTRGTETRNRVTDFAYLALSSEPVRESHWTGETHAAIKTEQDPEWERSKRYAYDPGLRRVGISISAANTNETTGAFTYSRNVRGDISLLVKEAGTAQAAYGYTPYGAEDAATTRGDSVAPGGGNPFQDTEPLNAYRFNDKRYDTGSGSIDMGARRFGPDTGRFLQNDYYRGALDDLDLGLDPLTSSRFSFAGGNPISFVEVDGHKFSPHAGQGGRTRNRNEQRVRDAHTAPRTSRGRSSRDGFGWDEAGGIAKGFGEAALRQSTSTAKEGLSRLKRGDSSPITQPLSLLLPTQDQAEYAARNPRATWNQIKEPYANDWNAGRGSETGGRIVFDLSIGLFGARGAGLSARLGTAATRAVPKIKPGSAGGATAGNPFPRSVKDAARAQDATRTCVFCGRPGTGTQVDHAIPRARGGNATLDNAQLACAWCNPSKGAGDFPRNPPPDYVGPWPPPWRP